jgi:hypothetical protein
MAVPSDHGCQQITTVPSDRDCLNDFEGILLQTMAVPSDHDCKRITTVPSDRDCLNDFKDINPYRPWLFHQTMDCQQITTVPSDRDCLKKGTDGCFNDKETQGPGLFEE